MKLYEAIILIIATLIAWPLIRELFKTIGYQIALLVSPPGYPVKYTSAKGKEVTFYLSTAHDVIEFTNDPKSYVESHNLCG